jgi:hypothetical protein
VSRRSDTAAGVGPTVFVDRCLDEQPQGSGTQFVSYCASLARLLPSRLVEESPAPRGYPHLALTAFCDHRLTSADRRFGCASRSPGLSAPPTSTGYPVGHTTAQGACGFLDGRIEGAEGLRGVEPLENLEVRRREREGVGGACQSHEAGLYGHRNPIKFVDASRRPDHRPDTHHPAVLSGLEPSPLGNSPRGAWRAVAPPEELTIAARQSHEGVLGRRARCAHQWLRLAQASSLALRGPD